MNDKITESENRLADYAQNLASWFGSERDTATKSIPSMPFESLYVKSMLDKMNGEYRRLKQLQAQRTEFDEVF